MATRQGVVPPPMRLALVSLLSRVGVGVDPCRRVTGALVVRPVLWVAVHRVLLLVLWSQRREGTCEGSPLVWDCPGLIPLTLFISENAS